MLELQTEFERDRIIIRREFQGWHKFWGGDWPYQLAWPMGIVMRYDRKLAILSFLYVDAIRPTGNDIKIINDTKLWLRKAFEMKDTLLMLLE